MGKAEGEREGEEDGSNWGEEQEGKEEERLHT